MKPFGGLLVSSCLLFIFFISSEPTSGQINQPNPGANSTASQGQKPLPWKSVATPQGTLSMAAYAGRIRAFGTEASFAATTQTVEEILARTVQAAGGTVPSTLLARKDLYFAIHVLEYGESPASVRFNAWYLYRRGISFKEFTGQRIYGSKDIVVLFLHLNAKGLDSSTVGSLTVPQQTAFSQGLLYDNDPKNHLALLPLGGSAVDSGFARVHYEAAVVRKTPANIQNALSILKLLGLSQAAVPAEVQVPTIPLVVWGSGAIQDATVPSDIRVAGYDVPAGDPSMANSRDGNLLGSDVPLNDEGRYWWDASIGIPVNKVKDLQYSSSDNTIEAAQVSKQSAYAMFNLMLKPIDLQSPNSNLMPRILLGFPLASDPWDKLFAGGGFGLPKIMLGSQFFGGAVFNRVSTPSTLTAGSSASQAQLANDSSLKVQYKLIIGISVPVKSVIDKLK